jgi:hypothetical protein
MNESRETRADRIVTMHPDGMAVVPENPRSFSKVHSFEQGQVHRGQLMGLRGRPIIMKADPLYERSPRLARKREWRRAGVFRSFQTLAFVIAATESSSPIAHMSMTDRKGHSVKF